MDKLHVRDIIDSTTNELWNTLPKKFELTFDNGETIITRNKTSLLTSLYWDIIRHYSNITIIPKHHIDTYIKNEPYGSNTHRKLIESFYVDIVMAYNLSIPILRDDLDKLIFVVNNNAYNVLSTKLMAYMTSIDILDFIEISDNEKIVDLIKNSELDQTSVANTSEKILDVVLKDPSLDNNRLAKATRYKIVRDNQVIQCVGIRGYPTDVDSVMFKYPIMTGYVKGLKSLYDSMTESRLAAKSQLFATAPLSFSEYLSRRIQLLSMSVENIHYGDCGSQKYLDCFINEDVIDEFGFIIKPSILPLMEGKYYLDKETNSLKALSRHDKHLIGQWIKIRSPVAGCQHPDPHGICSVCYGDLSQNIPPNCNIGHLNASILGQIIAQLILSVKHFEKSADISYIKLDARSSKFFYIDKTRDKYYIKPEVLKEDYYVEISKDDLLNLNDILHVQDISYSDISRTSNISSVNFFNSYDSMEITVKIENRLGVLSPEFIDYIKRKKWIINNKYNYVFNISDWDTRKPFIILPKKHFNNVDLSKAIETIIKGSVTQLRKRNTEEATHKTLWTLFELVNSKLTVNFAIIETIMYASMVVDAEQKDTRLPKAYDRKGLGVLETTLTDRSLSGLLAYEGIAKELVNPSSFFPIHRENFIMDVYIDPYSVMRKHNKQT